MNSGISSIQPSSGNVNSSASSTSIQSHIKPAILKDIADSRNRSSSPYNSSAANPSGSGTPSLYVSVPLSNANVPGINLPSASANGEYNLMMKILSRSVVLGLRVERVTNFF